MSEAALRRSRRRPEAAPPPSEPRIGLVELDREFEIRRVNSVFTELFGATAREATGSPFCRWFLPAVRDTMHRELNELVHGRTDRFDLRLVGLGRGDTAFLTDVTGRTVGAEDKDTRLVVLINEVQVGESPPVPLKLAELDVRILEGLAAGESTIQIAMRLYLSRQAIDYRVGAMRRKLGAPNRAALVSNAYTSGLLDRLNWPPRVTRQARKE
ncbi:LuxR C-terminal-related transcriptional regulator [Amycolatopsis sp. H20-H5]|uniref:LuxR C-terminal-related transcriptional regulator n=1 Tax=Amycolatopsis sp. H20-H5 TaxID=3046309 RepID=UPI002DBC0C7A|nr:LuxR C-terminal-related transcriptional regulator [Amycolatopsis sp. H20-H5]MEC3975549.1 LuxR C-terminal-related transcriptional regulator [Amycolatopsis sp. H20-H5]